MKPRFSSRIVHSVLAFLLLLASNIALPYVVDVTPTAPANPSGLWWNPNESGWGMTVTQQSNIMFITMYTYAPGGAPVWYVASNCTVAAAGCTGDLYRVDGGRPPNVPWAPGAVTRVGSVTLAFTDNNNGSVAVVIDGVQGTKTITRQLFGPIPVTANNNQAKTQLLLGGTWSFVYVGNGANRTRRFSFNEIEFAGGGTDDYAASGTNETGELIAGGYVSAQGIWGVMDPGTTMHDFFTFTFVDTNHVAGCYISIRADTFAMGHCADMTGSRTPPR